MRIGITIGGSAPFPDMELMIARAKMADEAGLHSAWFAHLFSYDALTLAAAVARETRQIMLGTSVVPTFPRHPITMAQQALTIQAASGGRFILGIGPSHKPLMEDCFGYDYSRPLTHLREYCAVMNPLLEGKAVDHQGKQYRAVMAPAVDDAAPVPLMVAALGPKMLEFAGRETDGTITFLAHETTLRDHIVPRISAAATEARRPAPQVVAVMPIVLTDDLEAGRKQINEMLAAVPGFDSYKTMLARGDASGPADVSLIGNAQQLKDQINRLEDAGATEIIAGVFTADAAEHDRTLEFLASLV